MENSQIKIFIHSPKPFYYPGEQILVSIFLDVLETVNSNKMIITTKGKEIIKAKNNYIPQEFEEYEESEEDENDINNISKNLNEKEPSNEEGYLADIKKQNSNQKEINIAKNIFKYKTTIKLSNNNYISKGKYIYPLEIDIPENIPGSFLYLDNNVYVEIIYSIKVKFINVDIKEKLPLIIRQKEKIFNYPREKEYKKNVGGCCWERGEAVIKINSTEKYFLGGNKLKLNIIINNENSGMQGSPINIEFYQKIVLFPKQKTKKIKITKIVGKYKGNKKVKQRENFNEDISFLIDENKNIANHFSKTKAVKYFKNNNILPFLTQSIKSEFVICQYEIYAESQFIGLSIDDLGVFLKVILYPPEKGILMKNFDEINKEFSNSLVNKKVFLNSDTINEISLGNDEKTKNKLDKKSNIHKSGKKSEKSKKHKVGFKLNKSEINEDDKENQNINELNNINNDDINQNFNINYFKNSLKNQNKNEDNFLNEEEIFNITTNNKVSNNSKIIKKNFSQNFLNDELDKEFLENS